MPLTVEQWIGLGTLAVAVLSLAAYLWKRKQIRGGLHARIARASGPIQIAQGDGMTVSQILTSSGPNAPDQETNSDLRSRAQRCLHTPDRFAEGLHLARELAHRIGDRDTARWLGWELNGQPENASERDSNLFMDRAPYRKLDVKIPFHEPVAHHGRPDSVPYQIFFSSPIEFLEASIDRMNEQADGVFVMRVDKDELFRYSPSALQFLRADVQAVPVMIEPEEFSKVKSGLRVAVDRWLASTDLNQSRN